MAKQNAQDVDPKTREMNEAFVKRATATAMEVIRERVKKEKAEGNLNTEIYHSIQNPFENGTAEYAYIEDVLSGSGKDPRYVDLFDRMRTALKEALDEECGHSFLMLNCRFDPTHEDNFLLYALVSWGG